MRDQEDRVQGGRTQVADRFQGVLLVIIANLSVIRMLISELEQFQMQFGSESVILIDC